MCPREHICYCDGFGLCCGGEEEYEQYWVKKREREKLEKENERMWRVLKHEKTDKVERLL